MPKWKYLSKEQPEKRTEIDNLKTFKNVTLADAELNMKKLLKNVLFFDKDLAKLAYSDLTKEVEEIVNNYDDKKDDITESCLLIQERYTKFIVDLIVNLEDYSRGIVADTDGDNDEEIPEEEASGITIVYKLDVYPNGKQKAVHNASCYYLRCGMYIVPATEDGKTIYKTVEEAQEAEKDEKIAWFLLKESKHRTKDNGEFVTYHLGSKYADF